VAGRNGVAPTTALSGMETQSGAIPKKLASHSRYLYEWNVESSVMRMLAPFATMPLHTKEVPTALTSLSVSRAR